MKLAVLSESSADEAAVRMLVEALLAAKTELPSSMPPIRTRGWHAVRGVLPTVLKALHYHSDADALAVVVDSDRSPIHQLDHKLEDPTARKCRLCQLQTIVNDVLGTLRPRQGRTSLKVALGLAVPSIEAWYLAGLDPHVTESTSPPFTTNSLKVKVYGTDRPSLALETQRAVEAIQRLTEAGELERLENRFPAGFGALARDVRNW
jgi:hypothetical protein